MASPPQERKKKTRAPARAKHPVQQYVGRRISLRRTLMKLTHADLARALKVDVDYIAALENGTTQASISDLMALAKQLNVSVMWFFMGLADAEIAAAPVDPSPVRNIESYTKGETREALLNYFNTLDMDMQKKLVLIAAILSLTSDD